MATRQTSAEIVPFSFAPSTVTHAVAEVLGGGDLVVGEAADALFGEGFLQCVTDFGVLHRDQGGGHFHQRDLGAEGVVDVGELDADGPGTDDDHAGWLFLQDHRLA